MRMKGKQVRPSKDAWFNLVGLFVNSYLYILWFKQVIDGKALHNTSTKTGFGKKRQEEEEKVEF